MVWDHTNNSVTRGSGGGFMEAASFVGHFIDCGLLDRELVRLHLIKPLTTHLYSQPGKPEETVRLSAICRLFVAAGTTLVQGLLESEDVQACFKTLEAHLSKYGTGTGLSSTKLEVQCAAHPIAPHQNPLTHGLGTSRTPCRMVAAE